MGARPVDISPPHATTLSSPGIDRPSSAITSSRIHSRRAARINRNFVPRHVHARARERVYTLKMYFVRIRRWRADSVTSLRHTYDTGRPPSVSTYRGASMYQSQRTEAASPNLSRYANATFPIIRNPIRFRVRAIMRRNAIESVPFIMAAVKCNVRNGVT